MWENTILLFLSFHSLNNQVQKSLGGRPRKFRTSWPTPGHNCRQRHLPSPAPTPGLMVLMMRGWPTATSRWSQWPGGWEHQAGICQVASVEVPVFVWCPLFQPGMKGCSGHKGPVPWKQENWASPTYRQNLWSLTRLNTGPQRTLCTFWAA